MTDLTGKSLGRYHLLTALGEGGMAVVYKAFDTRLEREVAVKVIRTEMFGTAILDRILKRFEREAKALARLSHPNIVRILDTGEDQDVPYLVMEYIEAGSLKHRLGKPLPLAECIQVVLPVSHALHYAHQRGIVHRDVKPSNILINAQGQPLLSDFGIAQILEGEDLTSLTGTGLGVGTPEYMAPEQWTGKSGTASDQYALGIVLYEMVTGRKPYQADTPAAILLKQATAPLPRPTQFVPDLPLAAEHLLIKTLSLDPANRYADLGVLADALARLSPAPGVNPPARPTVKEAGLEGEQPTRDGPLVESVSWPAEKLKRPWLPFLIGGLAALAGLAFLFAWLPGVLNGEAPAISTSSPLPILSSATPQVTVPPSATPAPSPTRDLRLSPANAGSMQEVTRIGLGILEDGVWDGSTGTLLLATSTGLLRIDPSTGEILESRDTALPISLVAVSTDGLRIATAAGGSDPTIQVWSADGLSLLGTFDLGVPVEAIALSPDGRRLAAAWNEVVESRVRNGRIMTWEVDQGRELSTISYGARHLQFSLDGKSLYGAAGNKDTSIKIWDPERGELSGFIPVGSQEGLRSFQISEDGTQLAFYYSHTTRTATGQVDDCGCTIFDSNSDNYFQIWDLEKNQGLARPKAGGLFHFSADGQLLFFLVPGSEGTDSLYQADLHGEDPRLLAELPGSVRELWYESDGKRVWFYSTGMGRLVTGNYALTTGEIAAQETPMLGQTANDLAISPDGNLLVIYGQTGYYSDQILLGWSIHEKQLEFLSVGQGAWRDQIADLVFSPVGNLLGVNWNQQLINWAEPGGDPVLSSITPKRTGYPHWLEASSDGVLLALGGYDLYYYPETTRFRQSSVLLVDAESGQVEQSLILGGSLRGLAFMDQPDALLAAAGAPENRIHRWEIASGDAQVLVDPSFDSLPPEGDLLCMAVDVPEDLLLIGFGQLQEEPSSNGAWQLRDATSGDLLHTERVEQAIVAAAISPDGSLLALAGVDGRITLWDAQTFMLLETLTGHTGAVNELLFTPDGWQLASASDDGTVRLWAIQE